MNIQTVRDNLKNTIAGKEALLAEYESKNILLAGMLRVNIDELKRILQDLEQCRPDWTPFNCPYAEAETCHRMD